LWDDHGEEEIGMKDMFVPSSWKLLDGTVQVESESVPGRYYFVGVKSLKCSCPHALNGHVCKHARWVHNNKATILALGKGGIFEMGREN
jgi:hypothetical protein